MSFRTLKLASVFLFCLLFRLLPFRPPNVETILASQMPIGKQFGALPAFFFGFFSILAFDLATGTLGYWSIVTAPAYGLLGFGSAWYLKNHSGTRHFVYFAIIGTLFYDVVTGLVVGPLFFHQSFTTALIGQIPFTVMHLLGNIAFAVLLSPFVEKWIVARGFFFLERIRPCQTQNPNKSQRPKTEGEEIRVCLSSAC